MRKCLERLTWLRYRVSKEIFPESHPRRILGKGNPSIMDSVETTWKSMSNTSLTVPVGGASLTESGLPTLLVEGAFKKNASSLFSIDSVSFVEHGVLAFQRMKTPRIRYVSYRRLSKRTQIFWKTENAGTCLHKNRRRLSDFKTHNRTSVFSVSERQTHFPFSWSLYPLAIVLFLPKILRSLRKGSGYATGSEPTPNKTQLEEITSKRMKSSHNTILLKYWGNVFIEK